jgi:hypothetical protein
MRQPGITIAHIQHVFDFKAAVAKATEIRAMEERLPELLDAAKEERERAEKSPEARALWLVKEEIKARRADLLEDDDLAALKKKAAKAAKAWKESEACADLSKAQQAAKAAEVAIRTEYRRLNEAILNGAR